MKKALVLFVLTMVVGSIGCSSSKKQEDNTADAAAINTDISEGSTETPADANTTETSSSPSLGSSSSGLGH